MYLPHEGATRGSLGQAGLDDDTVIFACIPLSLEEEQASCRGVHSRPILSGLDHGQRPGFAWKVPAGGSLPCPSVSGTALHHSLWREFQGMRQAPRLPAQVSGFLGLSSEGLLMAVCSALFPTLTQYVFTPSPSSRHAPNPYPDSLAHKRAGALFRTPRNAQTPSLLSTPGSIPPALTLPCPVGRRGPGSQARSYLGRLHWGRSEPRLAMTLGLTVLQDHLDTCRLTCLRAVPVPGPLQRL